MRIVILFLVSTLLFYGCTSGSSESIKTEPENPDALQEEIMEANYLPFDKELYLKAREENKIIFLEFYANWCPVCASQEPEIEDAFSEIMDPDIVGFRVNYKDSDTDQDEIDLAREFGITYQHTHVIIKDGETVKKSQEFWDKQRILEELEVS